MIQLTFQFQSYVMISLVATPHSGPAAGLDLPPRHTPPSWSPGWDSSLTRLSVTNEMLEIFSPCSQARRYQSGQKSRSQPYLTKISSPAWMVWILAMAGHRPNLQLTLSVSSVLLSVWSGGMFVYLFRDLRIFLTVPNTQLKSNKLLLLFCEF